MFSFLRRAAAEDRIVERGRVSCPLRGQDADVEDCLQCGFACKVDLEAKTPFVRCRPPRKLLLLP